MKILMVSMPSLHFFRWTEQLKDSGHAVYWFDITGMDNLSPRLHWAIQKTAWKLKWDYPGRTFVKKYLSKLYKIIQKYNERSTEAVFQSYLEEVQPDVVHSFALYVACKPILQVMQNDKYLKWIYSSWGSDLFYFQNIPSYLKDIKLVLPRINYLFADCKRDFEIAKTHGFTGEFLGVFPGGGGFPIDDMAIYSLPFKQRKTVLIKGFQGRSGRAIPVLKAMELIKEQLIHYNLVVFGADLEVYDYIHQSSLKTWDNFQVKGKITQQQVWQLMGESLIYIGNSNSDGMPNTLLEAICMGAFPIQSNPGGASGEVINNDENGLLIEDCENPKEIAQLILQAVKDSELINKAFQINQGKIKPEFEKELIKVKVLEAYQKVFEK